VNCEELRFFIGEQVEDTQMEALQSGALVSYAEDELNRCVVGYQGACESATLEPGSHFRFWFYSFM
jgi:hypothetical protein